MQESIDFNYKGKKQALLAKSKEAKIGDLPNGRAYVEALQRHKDGKTDVEPTVPAD